MGKQKLDVLVSGGKATAAPPLGPALGPLGVNIGQVIAEINKKTAAFAGMQVPVTLVVDEKTKEFDISVGTPPASELIKKEAKIEKGAGNPLTDKVADLKIEQIIKISQMKEDNLLGKDAMARVKEIIGTCAGMGVMVEGKPAKEIFADLAKFKDKIESGKTELSDAELKALEEEKKKLQEEIEKRRHEFEATADKILKEMEGKTPKEIKKKMEEAGIPDTIIHEKAPKDAAPAKADAPAPAKK
ncbi:50S ribosomal protein L11 [Candidatus Woesearchaeota archaeon]|nr:50S ribosomal protein L11 [Candidatus Woesearchaeota archaeon]